MLYCTVHLWVHGMQLDGHGIIKGGKCVGMGMRRVCGNRGEVGLWRVRALLEWTVTDLCGCTLQCCAVCGGAWFPPHSILVMHGCRIMVASFNFCNRRAHGHGRQGPLPMFAGEEGGWGSNMLNVAGTTSLAAADASNVGGCCQCHVDQRVPDSTVYMSLLSSKFQPKGNQCCRCHGGP